MFGYLKQYRKESILGPLFKLLEAAIDLIIPLVVAQIVDNGIRTHDLPFILKMQGPLCYAVRVKAGNFDAAPGYFGGVFDDRACIAQAVKQIVGIGAAGIRIDMG